MSTPSTSNTNANIPGGAPLVDQSGQITQVWYQFLLALFNRSGGAGTPTDITGLQKQVTAQDVAINTAVPVQPRPVLIGEGIVPVQRPVAPDFSQAMVYQPPGAYLTQASLTGYALKASPLSQFAATTSAQLAGVLSDETGTGSAVFATAPTLNQPNIVGVTANTPAAAGSVGESPTPTNLTNVALTNGVTANVSSISLGPGIYFVQAIVQVVPTGTTVISNVNVGVSTVSATQGALGSFTAQASGAPAGFSQTPASPFVRVPLGATTTVFAVVNASFSVSTCTANGFLSVLRVH